MTIPSLIYTQGTVKSVAPITSTGSVGISYDEPSGIVSIGSLGALSGQQIFQDVYTLDTDYQPTVIVTDNGVISDYGYQAAASFWQIDYQPKVVSSTVVVTTLFPMAFQSSGAVIFAYTSNVEGSLPALGTPAFVDFKVPGLNQQASQTISSVSFITNTTGSPISVYFCAYTFALDEFQLIPSSTSTATVLGGYVPATAQIIEVVS